MQGESYPYYRYQEYLDTSPTRAYEYILSLMYTDIHQIMLVIVDIIASLQIRHDTIIMSLGELRRSFETTEILMLTMIE